MAAISYDYPVIDASKTYEVPSECSISKLLVEQAPQHIFVGPLFYNALRHQGPFVQPGPRGIGLRLHLEPHFRKCIVVMDLLGTNGASKVLLGRSKTSRRLGTAKAHKLWRILTFMLHNCYLLMQPMKPCRPMQAPQTLQTLQN